LFEPDGRLEVHRRMPDKATEILALGGIPMPCRLRTSRR
jgi:hypothetical protein